MALTVAVVLAAGRVNISMGSISPNTLLTVTLPVIVGLMLISSLEEVVLRGYVLQLLAESSGRWIAALLTGLVFGLAHAENPGANLLGLANTAANGVLLAWLVMRTGSLWIACGYHAG